MNDTNDGQALHQRIGLVLGIVLFCFFLLIPFGTDPRTHRMAAVAALMATWWMTEALPLAATSLIPLVLMPVLKISDPETVARSYMNDYIFLYVGGFIIALGAERWSLHRRLALHTVARIGDRPRNMVLGFMLATGFVSMWISNTATTMMMLPLALSVISLVRSRQEPESEGRHSQFGLVLVLSIAYAASIGGMATLVGTPTNVVFAARFHAEFPGAPQVGFAQWMMMGVPLAAVFLVSAWAVLVFALHPLGGERLLGGREAVTGQLAALGKMSPAEARVLALFVATALLWIFRVDNTLDLRIGGFTISRIPGWSNLLGLADAKTRWISDGTVAMAAALLMFLVPSGDQKGKRLMNWKTAERLPWHILFLFGGGFALADGFTASGLSEYVGQQIVSFGRLPVPGMVIAVAAATIFLSELTSNVATANMVLPLLAGVARALQINPLTLFVPATIAASCGFMLPVATPPNAIVFGTGLVPVGAMVRAGFALNIMGAILTLVAMYGLAIPLWGINPTYLPPEWLVAR